jgi:hypothetical protein
VTHSTANRDYGHVLYGSSDPEKAENVAAKLVAEGLAKVRDNCNDAVLKEAQVSTLDQFIGASYKLQVL